MGCAAATSASGICWTATPASSGAPGVRGLPLIPWQPYPRRAFTFDGANYQVPLTDPESHNAIHGFLRWRNWTCRRRDDNAVMMRSCCTRRWGQLTVFVQVRRLSHGWCGSFSALWLW